MKIQGFKAVFTPIPETGNHIAVIMTPDYEAGKTTIKIEFEPDLGTVNECNTDRGYATVAMMFVEALNEFMGAETEEVEIENREDGLHE